MLILIILNVFMQSVVMLSAFMPIVIMLNNSLQDVTYIWKL